MNQSRPPSQPGNVQQARPGLTGLLIRLLNHEALAPMLSAVLVGGSGTVLVLYLMAHRWDLPGGLVMAGVVAAWVLAIAVLCWVAHVRNGRQKAQFLASIGPERLQAQRPAMQPVGTLEEDFRELRDCLCQGTGSSKEARDWRTRIDYATFPGAPLKEVVDRWLRWLSTADDSPLRLADLSTADVGVPLPGERRAPHMTPAWYATQVASALSKTVTPAPRRYMRDALVLLTLGGVACATYIFRLPFMVLTVALIILLCYTLSGLLASWGQSPGSTTHGAKWHTTS